MSRWPLAVILLSFSLAHAVVPPARNGIQQRPAPASVLPSFDDDEDLPPPVPIHRGTGKAAPKTARPPKVRAEASAARSRVPPAGNAARGGASEPRSKPRFSLLIP